MEWVMGMEYVQEAIMGYVQPIFFDLENEESLF